MVLHNYPKEFVERTLILLDKCYDNAKQNELEVTFLLNCLLGLIIATYEKMDVNVKDSVFGKRLWDEEISKFIPTKIAKIDLNSFYSKFKDDINTKSLIGQLDEKVKIENEIEIQKHKLVKNLTLKEFIRNIRNGIAHQNLMATSQSEHWEGVRIWNHNKDGIKDFEVEFTISQLKKFAVFIGREFIKAHPDK